MNSLRSQIMNNDTHFGLIVEYLTSFDYVNSICLISKYHYEFPKNETYNFNIIRRMLSREFFNVTDNAIAERIGISAESVYQSIWIVHHFYLNMKDLELIPTKWMKRDFWSRWRYLTSNANVEIFGIKYWIKSISELYKTEISHLFNFNEPNNKGNLHISTAMIYHSNMNGHKQNKFDVNKCTELMDFCVSNGFDSKITQFRQLIVCTLDVNKNRDGINHTMFAWTINYLLNYFEKSLQDLHLSNDINHELHIYYLQDFSAMITELILLLHTAKVEHDIDITPPSDQFEKLTIALKNYSIQTRLKEIWSKLMGGNMINFTAGFSLRVSAFFNVLMGLTA